MGNTGVQSQNGLACPKDTDGICLNLHEIACCEDMRIGWTVFHFFDITSRIRVFKFSF